MKLRKPLTAAQIEQAQEDYVRIQPNPDGSWPYEKVAAVATMHQACAEYAAFKRNWAEWKDGESIIEGAINDKWSLSVPLPARILGALRQEGWVG